MKRIGFVLSLLLLIGCSDNDDDGAGVNGDYYPAAEGNYWTYEVEASESGRDSVYTSGSLEQDGKSYNTFQAKQPIYGVYTLLLTQAGIRSEGGRIYVNGSFEPFADFPVAFEVELNDLLILDPSQAQGAILAEESLELSVPYEEYTINLSLDLRTEMLDSNGSMTIGDNEFNDVSSALFTISGSGAVTASLDGVPVTIPVLGEQEMLRMEVHFARDIGMIYAETTISLELSNLDLAGLDIPDTYLEQVIQEISDYLIVTP